MTSAEGHGGSTSRPAALVTGASSGLGRAIAMDLARRGYSVTIVSRSPEKLATAADDIARAGGDGPVCHTVAGDLRDEDASTSVVASHSRQFGRLDVLVNSAGVGIRQPIEDIQTKHLDLQVTVNIRGTILVCREAAGLLRATAREHGVATCINLASVVGKQGAPGYAAYSASKAAVLAFTEAMNRELGADGVRCTAVCPSLVATPMTAGLQVDPATLISEADVVAAVNMAISLSPACVVPEVVLTGLGGALEV